jgi:hypothetical protein
LHFLARDHLTRPFEKHPEYLDGLTLEPNAQAMLPQFAGVTIEFKHTEPDDLGCRGGSGVSDPGHGSWFTTGLPVLKLFHHAG